MTRQNESQGQTTLSFEGRVVSLRFTNGLIFQALQNGINPAWFWPDLNGDATNFLKSIAWLLGVRLNISDKIECDAFLQSFDGDLTTVFASLMVALVRDGVIETQSTPSKGQVNEGEKNPLLEFANYRANSRQRLRLSVAEIDAMTPAETQIELEVYHQISKERYAELSLFDQHLAIISAGLFHHPNPKDFLRLAPLENDGTKSKKKTSEAEEKAQHQHAQIMAKAQKNLKAKQKI